MSSMTRRRRGSSSRSCASTGGTCRRRRRRSIRLARTCTRRSSSTTSSARQERGWAPRMGSTTDSNGLRPIGVFDSGVGGLTVFREISRALPREPLVYLGDSARVPYGTKSPATVIRYSLEAARHLMTRNIKMLVVACNTATAAALPALKEVLPIPVIGVVEPGARAAVERTSGVIGVIATEGTVKSKAYTHAIKA